MTAALLAIAASVLFGLGLALSPRGLKWLSPAQGAGISIPAAAALLAVASIFLVDWSGATLGGVAIFAVIGLAFPVGATVLTFEANRQIGPNATGTLGNLAPLFAVLFAVVVLAEAPSEAETLGIAVIVIGATALVIRPGGGAGRWPLWAIILPVAAALIRGAAQPLIKVGFVIWAEPLAAALFGYLASSLVIVGLLRLRDGHMMPMLDKRGVRWFVAVGLANGLAVLAMYAALADGPVTLVAPLVASYPLAVLGFSVLFGGTAAPTLRTAIGVGATVAGVAILLAA